MAQHSSERLFLMGDRRLLLMSNHRMNQEHMVGRREVRARRGLL